MLLWPLGKKWVTIKQWKHTWVDQLFTRVSSRKILNNYRWGGHSRSRGGKSPAWPQAVGSKEDKDSRDVAAALTCGIHIT